MNKLVEGVLSSQYDNNFKSLLLSKVIGSHLPNSSVVEIQETFTIINKLEIPNELKNNLLKIFTIDSRSSGSICKAITNLIQNNIVCYFAVELLSSSKELIRNVSAVSINEVNSN